MLHNLRGRPCVARNSQGRSLSTRVTGAIFFVANLTSPKSDLVFGFVVSLRKSSKSRSYRKRPHLAVKMSFRWESAWNITILCFQCPPLFAHRSRWSESVYFEGESLQRTRNSSAEGVEDPLPTNCLEEYQAILFAFRKEGSRLALSGFAWSELWEIQHLKLSGTPLLVGHCSLNRI